MYTSSKVNERKTKRVKIAIDISPLSSGHKVRGVGFYLLHLKKALETYFPQHTYVYFTNQKDIPQNTDIVHIPYFNPFFKTLPLVKTKKTVVTVHDLIPLVFPEYFPTGIRGKIQWQINKMLLKQADAIITDSNCSAKDVFKLTGIPKEKVQTVYLAAGEEFKQVKNATAKSNALQKKYQLPEKFVLYVGDVTWNKNVPRIIQAVTRAKVPLVMVGKALAEKDFDKNNLWNIDRIRVQELSANNPYVHILGFVSSEELVMFYNSATVFVMPSLYEGFGLPILEAMSCGCPVITSKEGSLFEVAGESALYVDAQSTDIIAKKLKEVFFNTSLQKELKEKGFQRVRQFSWKETASQTTAVYERVNG